MRVLNKFICEFEVAAEMMTMIVVIMMKVGKFTVCGNFEWEKGGIVVLCI